MVFNLSEWKSNITAQLENWAPRMRSAGINSIYAFISASALWPIVESVRNGEWAALATLGGVIGSIGGNLLANQIQNWKDVNDAALKIVDQTQHPEVRNAIDKILEELEVVKLAFQHVSIEDQNWFVETLRTEIQEIKSGINFSSSIVGDGASAQGAGAIAVGAGGVFIGGNFVVNNTSSIEGKAKELISKQLRLYLENLYNICQSLPLAALGDDNTFEENIKLDSVYIELDTTFNLPPNDLRKLQNGEAVSIGTDHILELNNEEYSTVPFPLLDAAINNPRLVILGDPGSGKSTFTKNLLAIQALILLGKREKLPGIDATLFPVFVNLRDVVPRIKGLNTDSLPVEKELEVWANEFRSQVFQEVARISTEKIIDDFDDLFSEGSILLVLDGLDEVPEQLREVLKKVIFSFLHRYHIKRVIVTCRARAYWGESILQNFHVFSIAPLDESKITRFVQNWYQVQSDIGYIDPNKIGYQSEDLISSIYIANLSKIASNPMLLTSICMIHQRNINLPTDRVYIYNLMVDILVRRWQKYKAGLHNISNGLIELLKDDFQLRSILERLAYEIHRGEKDNSEFSGLSRPNALAVLEEDDCLGDIGIASEFLEYIDKKVGILIGSGGDQEHRPNLYYFPHRRLQEYLAGSYIVSKRNLDREIFRLTKEGDHWSDSIEMGLEELYFNRRNIYGLLDLGYRLYQAGSTLAQSKKPLIWSGKIASLIGRNTIETDSDIPDGGATFVDKLAKDLLLLLDDEFGPHKRSEIGQYIGLLGDPRIEVLTLDDMLFCEIPQSEFVIGTDKEPANAYEKPMRNIFVPTFYISRFPITNSQFSDFVRSKDGYLNDINWSKEGLIWRNGKNGPIQYSRPYNISNHPVVGVSWFECVAFCKWLEIRLNSKTNYGIKIWGEDSNKLLKERIIIRLPSEVEWEKAARGADARSFPWGDNFNSDFCNSKEAGLRKTVGVGLFPKNSSPYGVMDMSGNIWEWCQNIWGWKYADEFDSILNDPSGDAKRVVRGGGYENNKNLLRSTCRLGNFPQFSLDDLGFRIVALIKSS